MNRETLPCAKSDCERDVLPEESRVRVEGHILRTDDRDSREDYYAHLECWHELTAEWGSP